MKHRFNNNLWHLGKNKFIRFAASPLHTLAVGVDDAQWHLEAVLNYTYGDAGQLTSDIQCDTFYYTIHTEKDEVPLYQLNEAFNAFSQNVEKAFGNCTLPDKSVLAIQTTFVLKNTSQTVNSL